MINKTGEKTGGLSFINISEWHGFSVSLKLLHEQIGGLRH
ncbi:hypothetical protein PAAL109150_18305 [Paenibacillus alkaliterrae]